jgi:hypothetical protein
MIPVRSPICESRIGIGSSSVFNKINLTADPDAMIEKVRRGKQPLNDLGVAR